MFGRSCIDRWLTERKSCPTCKRKAVAGDIRPVFVSGNMQIIDNSLSEAAEDREKALKKEIVSLKERNHKLEEEYGQLNRRFSILAAAQQKLQSKFLLLQRSPSQTHTTIPSLTPLTYIMSPVHANNTILTDYTVDPSPNKFRCQPVQSSQPTRSSPPMAGTSPVNLGGSINNAAGDVKPTPSNTLGSHRAASLAHLNTSASSSSAHLPGSHTPMSSTSQSVHSIYPSNPNSNSMNSVMPPAVNPTHQLRSISAPSSLPPGLNESSFPLVEVVPVENGRCLDFDSSKGHIFFSSSPTSLPSVNESSHGVLMIHVDNPTIRHYLPLHTKAIRDLHFRPSTQLLLTAGFDRCAKIASVTHGTIVSTIELPHPAWSCQWNATEDYLLHIGLQSGDILSYDYRQCRSPLMTLTMPNKQPVHSIITIGDGANDAFEGIIAATSSHCTLFKSSNSSQIWDSFELPVSTIPRMVSQLIPSVTDAFVWRLICTL